MSRKRRNAWLGIGWRELRVMLLGGVGLGLMSASVPLPSAVRVIDGDICFTNCLVGTQYNAGNPSSLMVDCAMSNPTSDFPPPVGSFIIRSRCGLVEYHFSRTSP